MDAFRASIEKNPNNTACVKAFTATTADYYRLTTENTLWNGFVRVLDPPRLTTAWLCAEDPLMLIAGAGYRATEVRDKSFALQEEALNNLRGNRKLTKCKMGDALSSLRPTQDDTKVVARILLSLKHIQTVCFDEAGKKVWTMPEDLRAWSPSLRTLWVDAKCEKYLDYTEGTSPRLGQWLSDREADGWNIEWPVSEETYEDMKRIALERGVSVKPPVLSEKTKPKKEDFARVLGRLYAVEHLMQC